MCTVVGYSCCLVRLLCAQAKKDERGGFVGMIIVAEGSAHF